MESGFFFGYLIGWIISGVICGLICKAVASNRGMEGGFWWGFWLWIIGIIIVAVRPNDNRPSAPASASHAPTPMESSSSPVFVDKAKQASALQSSSERTYSSSQTRVYTAPENLYTPGSPIIIEDGALLKDPQTGKIAVQLKLKNIGAKTIKAVKLRIWPLDTINTPLGDSIDYEYLDIEVNRDSEFGQEELIPVPDITTRAFTVELLRVAFTDNKAWTPSEKDLKSLPKTISLHDDLKDNELVKQYCIEYGEPASIKPRKYEDLWFCTCSAVNRNQETKCHSCGKSMDSLFAFNLKKLKATAEKRLQEEKAERERIEKEERIAREKKKRKNGLHGKNGPQS